MQDGLRPVLGLDHHVCFGEPGLEVAALVPAWLVVAIGVLGVERGLEDVPSDVDEFECLSGLLVCLALRHRSSWTAGDQ